MADPQPALRVVLLDVDGTLIDSNDAHAQSWAETFAELGYDVPFDRVRPLIGMGGDKLLMEAAGVEQESPAGKRLSERRTERFLAEYLPRLRPFPRVRELVQRMRDDGLTIVVATSAQGEEMSALLDQAGIADLIEEATSSSDAERSKPDPDIVEAALERGGRPAAETIMLGDTPYDIEAAGRAGVGVIALRCGGWDGEHLARAVAIYDDPAELLANYDSSPLARNGR